MESKRTKKTNLLKKGALFLVVSSALAFIPNSVFAADYSDVKNHWAKTQISKFSEYGIIQGADGNFRPDDSITRGEIAVIIDKLMNYQVKAQNTFSDLDEKFYTSSILKANHSNIITGSDGKVRPNDKMTREETAVLICKAFGLEKGSASSLKFDDNDSISPWSKEYVATLSKKGYISGNNNKFNPKDNITRAEVVTMLNNIIGNLYNKVGTYSDNINKTVIVNTPNVILKDMNIDGDLIIAEGVGEGDLTLDNVIVAGRVLVRGGGQNSIYIKGNSNIKNLRVEKIDGKVRVVSDTNIDIAEIADGSDDIILSSKVNKLILSSSNNEVKLLNSEISNIFVNGNDINLTLDNSNIQLLSAVNPAKNLQLEALKNSSIQTVKSDAENTLVVGEGKISNVQFGGSNSKLNVVGAKLEVLPNTKGVIALDKAVSPNTKVNLSEDDIELAAESAKSSGGGGSSSSSGSSSNSGGSSNNSSPTRSTVTPTNPTTNTPVNPTSPSVIPTTPSTENPTTPSTESPTTPSTENPTAPSTESPTTTPVPENIKIDRIELIKSGELNVILNKATSNALTKESFYIYCPTDKDMTIISVSTKDNKVYTLNTSYFKDNTYTVEVTFNDGTTDQKDFVSKSNFPVITNTLTKRVAVDSAQFIFNSDEPGTIYYMPVVSVAKSVYLRSVTEDVYAINSIPTVDQIKQSQSSAMVSGSNIVAVSGLAENLEYDLYYIAENLNGTITDIRGPIKISSSVDQDTTGDISIESVKGFKNRKEGTMGVIITLTKPTDTPLTMDAFFVKCPAESPLNFNNISNQDNRIYTLSMRGGYYDNYYEVKVTFPNGNVATGGFQADFAYPTITGMKVERVNKTTAKVSFNSNEQGTFYYGTALDSSSKPTDPNWVIANCKSIELKAGNNEFEITNLTSDDKHLYYLAVDNVGNYPTFVDASFGKIPD